MAETAPGNTNPEAKKSSPIVLILVMAVMSAVAVGSGYGISSVFKGGGVTAAKTADAGGGPVASGLRNDRHGDGAADKDAHGGDEDTHGGVSGTGHASLVKLDPIIATLPQNGNTWLRLELALVLDVSMPAPDQIGLTQISSDISGLLRSIDLDHVSRPSGYVHLKEDLLDRARMTSGEVIKDVMIVSLVAE